jgi:hypothetical protein
VSEIFSEEWALEDEPILEFKCTNCGCSNVYFPESIQAKRILEKGVGIFKTELCIKGYACLCHSTQAENPHRILMRETTLRECAERAVLDVD